MNLREEIDLIWITKDREEGREALLALFKKWALEMVGEDDDQRYEDDPSLRIARLGRNAAKHGIRERIEESTK